MTPSFRIWAEALYGPVRATQMARDYVNSLRSRQLTRAHQSVRFLSGSWIDNFSPSRDAIMIGEGSVLRGSLLVVTHAGSISIGRWIYLGAGSRIWSASRIVIGDNVLISHSVEIHDTDSHPIDWAERRDHYRDMLVNGHSNSPPKINSRPIVIGEDAWIGFGSTINKGVNVGRGAIVSSNSVVYDDVEPWTIVRGNPATIIRRLDMDEAALRKARTIEE